MARRNLGLQPPWKRTGRRAHGAHTARGADQIGLPIRCEFLEFQAGNFPRECLKASENRGMKEPVDPVRA
jgi:hypothetical protein